MSAQQGWALHQAVYARLGAQLAGQGPNGTNIEVFDHVPENPARVHCRIDGFNMLQRQIKANKTRHFFIVHLFDRPTTQGGAARGQKTVKQLQQTVIAALHGWLPSVTGASAVRHEDSDIAPDEDGLTQHALSRFSIYIGDS